jgi:hypothetical protein
VVFVLYLMNEDRVLIPDRRAVINGLAVVGFIALVMAGIWLAVYSTRFVPTVVNRVGSAVVYLGSVFARDEPALSVVPNYTASTTISFGQTSSGNEATATPEATVKPVAKPVTRTVGEVTSGTYQIGTTTAQTLSGFPDLVVNINAIGYLATTSAESFIASSTVPVGMRPAVKFTIKNVGTNVSGQWRFSASIPTQSSYLYYSTPQQPLSPGDSIDYTLGFDQANKGSGQTVSISVNFDRAITESSFGNNGASANLTIIGG